MVQGDVEYIQPVQPTVKEDITPILPFKHKGHLISVVDNAYKCPWCLRIFGTKQGVVRRHLSSPTGVCHRSKVTDDLPQCIVCTSHFSSTTGLLRHTNTFGGSCKRQGGVKDHEKVDIIKLGKCLFVCLSYCIRAVQTLRNEKFSKFTPPLESVIQRLNYP